MNYNLTVQAAKDLITAKLSHNMGVAVKDATNEHFYKATALVLRDLMSEGYREFSQKVSEQKRKTVYYLCMEFLLGRSLKNNICNLNLEDTFGQALKSFGTSLDKIYEQEPDAGLGNGGLGRLAACFLDGLASQGYSSIGYSLRYEMGIFRQSLVDGWQTELPDNWLPGGSVWLQSHPDKSIKVYFNGTVEETWGDGKCTVKLKNATAVTAVPHDMYISGNDGKGISRLRLWAAKAEQIDMNLFNEGQHMRAMEQKAMAESITQILYPGDSHTEGKSLRLNQQYFLVSATIQDILRRHFMYNGTLENLPDLVTLHLNDTHPVLAVPELMRILMDDYGYGWDAAWDIVSKTIAYTNHTVMREALECWGEDMFRAKLPRIYQIIQELNRRYCESLHAQGIDGYQVGRMAILNDGVVKMANLAVMASYKVNGVSALHSQILKDTVFNDYYKVTPDKFTNVTNGIAHRRWLNQSNPELSALITELIGGGFRSDASELQKLMQFTDDKAVLEKLAQIKYNNKIAMAKYIKDTNGIIVDPNSIFDVQVKRLHEYKRQLLNALHIFSLWQYLRENPNADFTPKTYIFGAKAAPSYYFAKQIIQFIVKMAEAINADPIVNRKLQVVYLEDYRVTVAEKLMPASEISEQISLAGTEASGTGNMKFMINGALTLGTLDGANVEIHDAVGDENMFLFGMTTPEVMKLKANGYNPMNYYINSPVIKKAIDELNSTQFSHIAKNLTEQDPYMVLADFADYAEAQRKASLMYADAMQWNKMSLINIANAGIFAADRAINDYARNIWNLKPVE